MANLYGAGCAHCNREIAAALKEMPHMDGYLGTEEYGALYWQTPEPWPKPHVDGEPIAKAVACVSGDDGWVLAMAINARNVEGVPMSGPCACGSGDPAHELWRGKVELR